MQSQQILKLRRTSDRLRVVIAYCVAGLIISFAQIAFSAEAICVDNYADAAKSASTALKNAITTIKGQNLTNKSNGTHLKFSGSDRIVVKMYSTKGFGDRDLDFAEDVITICDKDGELTITSVLSSAPAGIAFNDKCFNLTGFVASMAGPRAVFCPGKVPEKVQAALERDSQNPTIASQPRPESNQGSIHQ